MSNLQPLSPQGYNIKDEPYNTNPFWDIEPSGNYETLNVTENGTYLPEAPIDAFNEVIVNVPTEETQSATFTENGTYTPEQGYVGFDEVTVDVEIPEPQLESKNIIANGTYTPTAPNVGFDEVTVNVPTPVPSLTGTTITTNGTYTPEEPYNGFDEVVVEVPLGTKAITANGTYTATDDELDGYSEVTVNVPAVQPNLKDETLTANGTYTAGTGYDGFDEVTVAVPLTTKTVNASSSSSTTYNAIDDNVAGYSSVTVNQFTPRLQNIVVDFNDTYEADQGYDGLGTVTVDLPLDAKTCTRNGTYYAMLDNLRGYNTVTVNVQPDLIAKSINANGSYSALIDDNVDGYSTVTVNVAPVLQDKTATTNGLVSADQGYDGLHEVTVALPLGIKSITTNGTYNASTDSLEGFSQVTVALPLDAKTVTANGTYQASSDNLEGYNEVTVAVPLGSKSITSNGLYIASSDNLAGYDDVTVNVQPALQAKTSTTNETVTPDAGYYGLSSVTVNNPYAYDEEITIKVKFLSTTANKSWMSGYFRIRQYKPDGTVVNIMPFNTDNTTGFHYFKVRKGYPFIPDYSNNQNAGNRWYSLDGGSSWTQTNDPCYYVSKGVNFTPYGSAQTSLYAILLNIAISNNQEFTLLVDG